MAKADAALLVGGRGQPQRQRPGDPQIDFVDGALEQPLGDVQFLDQFERCCRVIRRQQQPRTVLQFQRPAAIADPDGSRQPRGDLRVLGQQRDDVAGGGVGALADDP